MGILRTLLNGWGDIARATLRAFSVYALALAVAALLLSQSASYAAKSWQDIGREAAAAAAILFAISFFTALVFRHQVWRASRWPGGGGKKRR